MELSKLYVVEHNDDYKLTKENTGYTLEEYIVDMGGNSYYYIPNTLELFYHKLEVGMHHCTPVLIDTFDELVSENTINDLLEGKIDLYETLKEELYKVAIDLIRIEFEHILSNADSVKKKWS